MDDFTIKAIVFDLDGTLYEDTHHFDYYANQLEKKLPENVRSHFRRDYELAIAYEHAMQVGRIYDVKNDLILKTENSKVLEAYDWNGNKLNDQTLQQLYPNNITYDFHSMLNCGDIWWILVSIATHYGLDGTISHEAFLETRAYMMGPEFTMKPILGLKELLEALKKSGVHLFMLTNSPEPDSEAILKKLGINHLFTKKFFNGNKPLSTKKWFTEIHDQFAIDYDEIISVGDNLINEITPPQQLGCRTIFIDAHDVNRSAGADYIVRNMTEAIAIIKKITKMR